MELKRTDANNQMEFPFPFEPYNIQQDFMRTLYAVLRDGKLGIFESPTGTGKSLSIVCGAIKWLKDHNQQMKQDFIDKITLLENEKQMYENQESDWFSAQSKGIKITQKLNELKIKEKKLLEYEDKIEKIKNQKEEISFKFKKLHKSNTHSPVENLEPEDTSKIEDEELLLDEVSSNEKEHSDEEENEDSNASYDPTQIIIASRTHSQLSQLVGEIKKSPFGENVRVVSLASRQNYCINPSVRKLNNVTLINEKCLDLQKKKKNQVKTDSEGKVIKKKKISECMCPYYKQSNIEYLRGFALNQIHDIEDLIQVGRDVNACPYYTSRKAAEDAEIILVPYNTILHKSTREASGIRLKDNVVIIDEAHNILESLAQMYSSELSYPQLYYSLQALKCYKKRYNTLFSAITLRGLNQLVFVVNKLLALFEQDFKEEVTEILSLQSFMLSTGIDQYNFFNIIKFCKSSKLAQKVRSYSIKFPLMEETVKVMPKNGVQDFLSSIGAKKPAATKPLESPKFPMPTNPMLAVISFLECLTYSYEDGRILVTKNLEKQACKLQFLLLNPASNFSDIINEARSVIVAGGTMKPYAEFRDRLFIGAGACEDRILEFSCDHIIPQENILPIAITKGLKSEKLLFNLANRFCMGASLITILQRTCKLVKGGIVVFFPSYNYENWIYEQVKNIDFGRVMFREPQKCGSVDEVLEKYAATIKKSRNGAIMFSVVGGKLSEGLNFSDDLGRCIMVVGMPYANIKAADLKEKMSFLDKKEGQGAGQQFYENLCMKAVNQCIGRAVRHRNDYATVLLLDERYSRSNTQNALPDWIKRSLKVAGGEEAFGLIVKFFEEKNKQS
ncbi:ATP-dependent DNA helicase DDX11 [Euwallacea fornicatus]|uniref:ATP-dependent DNA helicase DDX11 n=1 Tax=Euwallacea fornicatus TaxID=995702 RepID=UPI00338F1782